MKNFTCNIFSRDGRFQRFYSRSLGAFFPVHRIWYAGKRMPIFCRKKCKYPYFVISYKFEFWCPRTTEETCCCGTKFSIWILLSAVLSWKWTSYLHKVSTTSITLYFLSKKNSKNEVGNLPSDEKITSNISSADLDFLKLFFYYPASGTVFQSFSECIFYKIFKVNIF